MDNTMFMAFATEFEEYQGRVYECVQAIREGMPIEAALSKFDVEYEDVMSSFRFAL